MGAYVAWYGRYIGILGGLTESTEHPSTSGRVSGPPEGFLKKGHGSFLRGDDLARF